MKRTISTLMMASAALVAGMVLMPLDAVAKKTSPYVTVNCDAGESIQTAIDKANPGVPLTLTVVGTCEEDVTIRRDDVGIYGNDNATVNGTFWLFGSQRIVIGNITVSGLGYGVHAIGSEVTLNNVSATENEEWAAVTATESSALSLYNSKIFNNYGTGVFVGISSSLVSGGNTVVSDNPGIGVQVELSSSALIWDGTSIQGNGSGIMASLHSSVMLDNANVSNNVSGGIALQQDGGVVLRGENTVSGNASGTLGVFCHDTESSYSNIGVAIDDPVICSGFDQ